MNWGSYEVYALRYATQPERSAAENFIFADPHDTVPMPLDFFLWVIKGHGRAWVVDTGFDAHTARKRQRTYLQHPSVLLREVDVEASQVEDVVITHMHYDHCANMSGFPNARFHIQEDEMAYCTGRCMSHEVLRKPFEVRDVQAAISCLFEGRLTFHKGRSVLAQGIVLHQVGGHTKGQKVNRSSRWPPHGGRSCWQAMRRTTGATCVGAARSRSWLMWQTCWRPTPRLRPWRTVPGMSSRGTTRKCWRSFPGCRAITTSPCCTLTLLQKLR